MNAGERFKKIRKEIARKNQKEMADLLGVSEITIRRYETGKTEIPKVVALALEALYSINHNWLLTGEGSMFVNEKREEKGEIPPAQAGIDRELAVMISMLSPEQQEGLKALFRGYLKKPSSTPSASSLEKQKETANLSNSHDENVIR